MKHQITLRDTGIKITDVLDMMSQGFGHNQILKKLPELSLSDILVSAKFAADFLRQYVTAEEIIEVEGEIVVASHNRRIINLTEIRKEHPRAYEKWESPEDNELVSFYQSGKKIDEIAQLLQRQPGAIRSRLDKLGLTGPKRRITQTPENS
jgi:uncharacterized protein (DUF433 family)